MASQRLPYIINIRDPVRRRTSTKAYLHYTFAHNPIHTMSLIDIKALNLLLEQIEQEKKIPREKLIDALEGAIAAAYKKDFGKRDQIIRCSMNPETGDTEFFQVKVVVDETTSYTVEEDEDIELAPEDERVRFNSEKHIMLSSAKLMKSGTRLGDEILFPLDEPESDFGRVAAQTAKQVIIQKLRDAERESVAGEFTDRVGTVVTGVIQRFDRGDVFVDLGRSIGILSREEKIPNEFYQPGKHIKVYLYGVDSEKGFQIKLSRAHPEFLRQLFMSESPEIANGAVQIKSIAREPGVKTKLAVMSNDPAIDPVGACVGQRGVRVNAVMAELGGERIDIIVWSPDPAEFIAAAISPAEPIEITLHEDIFHAIVTVPDSQLSLAIGRGGQNVRLAARLTGWRIDIQGDGTGPAEYPHSQATAIEAVHTEIPEHTETTEITEPAEEAETTKPIEE
jgi:N utilization substance protein A